MWSSFFHHKRKDDDRKEEPSTEEKGKAVTFHGDADEDLKKPKRISNSWVQSPFSGNDLTGKHGQHNLLDDDDQNLQSSSSTSTPMITSSTHSKRYLNLLEPKRISSRPLFIIRKSDSDILRFKEDNFDKAKRENKGFLFFLNCLFQKYVLNRQFTWSILNKKLLFYHFRKICRHSYNSC